MLYVLRHYCGDGEIQSVFRDENSLGKAGLCHKLPFFFFSASRAHRGFAAYRTEFFAHSVLPEIFIYMGDRRKADQVV